MSRIMAIDYGTRRVGIAVTDPLQIIASPCETVPPNELTKFIEQYLISEKVVQIVIGYPLKEDGSPTDITSTVDKVAEKLGNKFPNIRISMHDERYTSKMAQASMIQSGVRKKARKKKSNMDQVSATIILQSFMEQQKLAR